MVSGEADGFGWVGEFGEGRDELEVIRDGQDGWPLVG